jgi:stage II sporulation protein D
VTQQVRVGIYENINRAYITANKDFEVIELEAGSYQVKQDQLPLMNKAPAEQVLLRSSPATKDSLVLASEPDLNTSSKNILLRCKNQESCFFTVKEFKEDKNSFNRFRGELIIINQANFFTIVNNLDLEDYLRGVVPGEMPVSWPLEALKAQAVAARTYTLRNLGRRQDLGYDLKASVADQMYKGLAVEHPRATLALTETTAQVMYDKQGLLVEAYYSSHAGDFSASPESAWGISPRHYLIPVKEPDSNYSWRYQASVFDLSQKFSDLKIGDLLALTPIEYSMEGRLLRILISGAEGKKLLTGEEFRHKLGLKSTYFSSFSLSPSMLVIEGSGFGHGIGMSQHGARKLAELGYKHDKILKHYYSNVQLN